MREISLKQEGDGRGEKLRKGGTATCMVLLYRMYGPIQRLVKITGGVDKTADPLRLSVGSTQLDPKLWKGKYSMSFLIAVEP